MIETVIDAISFVAAYLFVLSPVLVLAAIGAPFVYDAVKEHREERRAARAAEGGAPA